VPRRRFRSVWLVLAGLCLAGGVAVLLPGVMPLLRSTENFQSFKHDARVRYEPGAEAAAAIVARALPDAIATVERAQFRPFAKSVTIHVCASVESFERFGYRASGAGGFVLNGRLFISPKQQNTAERLPRLLTHELSHLHFQQQIGTLGYARRLPGWFKEGMAVHVADGGGAESVSEAEGRDAIARGQVFRLDATDSLRSPQTAARDGLGAHLFYRESALFVGFLARSDPPAFARLMADIYGRKRFSAAIETAYGRTLGALWDQFTAEIKARY
jgi:hypothetical protein